MGKINREINSSFFLSLSLSFALKEFSDSCRSNIFHDGSFFESREFGRKEFVVELKEETRYISVKFVSYRDNSMERA